MLSTTVSFVDGMTLEDAIAVIVCGEALLLMDMNHIHSKETPKSMLDKLRSIVATCLYHHSVKELKQEDVNFSQHLYFPEVDPYTGQEGHDGGDHNHIYKCQWNLRRLQLRDLR